MNLDINTLLVVTVSDIVALALVSPAVMGLRIGAAANAARWALIVHAVAWVSMILSNFWPETLANRLLSTVAIAGFAGTNWLMFRALEGWLGLRRHTQGMRALCLLAPLGYVFMFDSYALRVGWSNTLLAAQMVLVTIACFAPRTTLRGQWRMVVAFCALAMAILTFGRGMLGAFTDLYPSFLTPHPWNIAAMLLTSLGPLMMNYAILGGWHEEAEVALHNQAITDALTGLFNRRGWQEVARPLVANANRYRLPLALLMIDIDFFKKINDARGHDAGDRALQALGALLHDCRRANDVTARVGGEEFCLLLPGSDGAAAAHLDQLLRQHLPTIATRLGHPLDFSTGLAVHRADETLEQLMARADTALYAAKQGGRGQLRSDETNT